MRKCGKKVTIWLVCFHFFFLVNHVCFISLTPLRERGGCSCEMMKFQGKVDVPSITGGGKVQINHLISPAFSPLSWGSRARGKSINLHKWDMTQRSLCLYSGLCTYLALALSLYNNSHQLSSRRHHRTRCKNIHWKFQILNRVNSSLIGECKGWNLEFISDLLGLLLMFYL